MGIYIYGKDIVHQIRPFAGRGFVEGGGVAIAGLVSARIYPDAPTEAQIDDTTGALGGFEGAMKTTLTTNDATKHIYAVTFDAIDDPEPHSSLLYDTWHPVWNVRYQNSEQVQFLYKPILLWRVVPQLSQLDIDENDVYAYAAEFEARLGATRVQGFITLAQERIFEAIRAKGLDRDRLQEVDLKLAAEYLAVSYCFRDMKTRNNEYLEDADHWLEQYSELWKGIKLGYDADDDGDIEPEEGKPTFRTLFVRA